MLPTTPTALQKQPTPGSSANGFAERFTVDGSGLTYATYLGGAGGDTFPTGIALDSNNDAYIAGETSAPAFPTTAFALQPAILGDTSGFLTQLTPTGDGLLFSTFIPGTGLTSIATDLAPATSSSAATSRSETSRSQTSPRRSPTPRTNPSSAFQPTARGYSAPLCCPPVPQASSPRAQVAPCGSPATSSPCPVPSPPVRPQPRRQLPPAPLRRQHARRLLPYRRAAREQRRTRLSDTTPAAPAVTTDGQTARTGHPHRRSRRHTLREPAIRSAPHRRPQRGAAELPGRPPLHALQRHRPMLRNRRPPFHLRPNSGSNTTLALSADDLPNLTLRNTGPQPATALTLSASAFTTATNCPTTLPAGAQCGVTLTGSGPGSLPMSASNAPSVRVSVPANSTPLNPLALSTSELGFGVVTSTSPVTRTVTVTNLGTTPQTFTSALDAAPTNPPYTFTEASSTCAGTPATHTLPAEAPAPSRFSSLPPPLPSTTAPSPPPGNSAHATSP